MFFLLLSFTLHTPYIEVGFSILSKNKFDGIAHLGRSWKFEKASLFLIHQEWPKKTIEPACRDSFIFDTIRKRKIGMDVIARNVDFMNALLNFDLGISKSPPLPLFLMQKTQLLYHSVYQKKNCNRKLLLPIFTI